MGTPTEKIEIELATDVKRELEAAAAALNLSLPAYVLYRIGRSQPDIDATIMDRMVHAVFGRYGRVMRQLAK